MGERCLQFADAFLAFLAGCIIGRRRFPIEDRFAQGVAEQNAANELVARKYGVPYLTSVASAFTVDDLIDNCHFNDAGHEKMATLLFQYLSSNDAALRADRRVLPAEHPPPDAAEGHP